MAKLFQIAATISSCDCGHHYCDTKCGKAQTNDDDANTCRICRLEYIEDHSLVEFLLSKLSLTREVAEELYRKEIGGRPSI